MNLWSLIPLISFIAFTIILIVVLPQAKKRVNRLFAVFLFASEIWSFTAFMLLYNVNTSTQYLIFWNGLVITAIPLVVVTYYHFLRAYNNKPGGIGVYLGYAIVLAILAFSLTGHVVKDAYFTGNLLYHDIAPWEFIIAAILTPFLALTLSMLIRRYRASTDPIDRNRTTYLITGWSILLVISYITPFSPALKTLPTDHIGNLANALIITYAIFRFQLLNIQLVMRKVMVYTILVSVVVGITTGSVLLGFNYFANKPILYVILFSTLVVLSLILAVRPLMRVSEKGVDRLFYRKTYDYRRALLGFSSKMSHILNLDALAKEILPSMTKAISITRASLLLQDSDSGDFNVQFAYPKAKREVKDELRFSADSSIVAWLDKKSSPINPVQIGNIPEFRGLWQVEKEQLTGSDLGLLYPLKSRDKLIGILALGKKQSGGLYSHEDIGLVASIANQAGIIIENAQLYTHAKIRANTDELTGLYNHRHFHERLEQEIARGSRFGSTFSLIMMDIDLFKAYNDIYGHLAGDQVLRRVGKYIESSIRSIDLAFRYGGEEFAIILPEARLDDAYKVAERIRKTIESKTSSRAMPITVSLGLANWPNDGVMKEEIIGRADVALYRAKQTGRNRACLSSEVLKPETPLIGAELEARPQALSIIYALAATVDAKDSYTYGHSRKVSEYAVAIAEALKLPQDRITTIRAAGLLHDIGKIGIPDSILKKRAPLTDEEWKPIKAHPELGVEILRHVIDLVNCLPAILHHHEHLDGSGYPAGLSGDSIPLEARILTIADAYDAMTSPRPYRERLSSDEAINELRRCAGTQFDPGLVEAFCKIVQQTEPKILGIKTETDSDATD
jgi:diguanylate cyclase (GGDEF)-like protein